MLYCAYGSNMNIEQMSWRCPNAEVVGTGVIPKYQLMFRGSPNSAVATIQPDRTSHRDENKGVPVVVWNISERDERSLDFYEGYPRLYIKELVKVTMSDGKTVEAMAYIMNDGYKTGVPSGDYFNTILDGYFNNGIDTEYLFLRLETMSKMSAGRRISDT
ncbi:MAG: gamma-glutamylcyclotransferase [Ruminococcus sp.]|nr:gamma-glutamylcyclotransferase [Ruminococcus sp.]MCM1380745.1 gamma-glutamylcyclotransferase [Muribaculaceae bacterium]MCM1478869.1 gamma-glutamylcyclotransferase [Muribaculaceae bacterium]